jgi:hypothetical protein
LTYPSSGYDYFVEVDGSVVKRSDNFNTIETYFVSKCADKHDDGHGRVLIGKHKLVNGVATLFSEIPTSSNTVAEIKTFLSARGISYKSSDSKTTLLETVDTLKPNPGG